MFIEFTTEDKKKIMLNTMHIISIEDTYDPVVMGMQGGGRQLRIFATENRVFLLDPKKISSEDLKKQIESVTKTVTKMEAKDVKDKGSPI